VSLTLTVVPELKLMTLIKPVSPAMVNNGLPSDSSTLNAQLKKLSFFCHPSHPPALQAPSESGKFRTSPSALSAMPETNPTSPHPSGCALARCIGRFLMICTQNPKPKTLNDFRVRLSALGGTQSPFPRHTADVT
jgi:hypothetical protein